MKKILFILITISVVIFPQRLSYNLSKVAGEYTERYVTPFVSAFGANFNTSLFTNSPTSGKLFGLEVYFGLKAFGTFVPLEDKTFNLRYSEKVDYIFQGIRYKVNAEVIVNNAPSVFGSPDPARVVVAIRDTIRVGPFAYPIEESREFESFGGVFSTDMTGLLIPHLEVGSVLGTSLLLRFLPPMKMMEYGEVNYIGFGLNHNLAQYLLFLPVNITLTAAIQQFGVKDSVGHSFISGVTFASSMLVSKKVSLFQFYTGVQYEQASIDVSYSYQPSPSENDPDPPPININFEMRAKNKLRFIVGTSVNFGPIALNLDYNLAQYSTIGAGLGILLRF
jgi:hypothetical protein